MWTIESKRDGQSKRQQKQVNIDSELQTIDEMDFDVKFP
jgi:hypothetical protein